MSRVPLLARLDAKEAAEIMPLLQAHNFPPNVEIIRKGAPGNAMYFIASGKLEVEGEERSAHLHGRRRLRRIGDARQ